MNELIHWWKDSRLSYLLCCNLWPQLTLCEKNVSILVFAGLCRSCAYSLCTIIIFAWILKKNEFILLFATLSNINSDDFHWLFCHIFSLQFCGVCKMNTHSGDGVCPLQGSVSGADKVLQQWHFSIFCAAYRRVLYIVILSLLFFFFPVHTPLHVILLHFYQETKYLFNTNRSLVCH